MLPSANLKNPKRQALTDWSVSSTNMLEHYNQCLDTATVPDSWMMSEVVMIVKNHAKNTRLMGNYRPISLTNISYKIFASMIQTRLEHYLDSRVWPTQFGFRQNQSTSQKIHVLRRLLHLAYSVRIS